MKAICLRARDGPEALAYDEAQQPRPGEGEVLVRVHAAGVIHTELSWLPTWTNRAGEPRPLPVIPGHEFSGEIAALGARRGVRRLRQIGLHRQVQFSCCFRVPEFSCAAHYLVECVN